MFSLMLEPASLPFAVALVVMLGIGLLEGIATLAGAGLSHVLDGALDSHLELDSAHHAPMEAPGLFGRFLDWFHIGRVPVLAVLVMFLLCFGLAGLMLQATWQGVTGGLLPGWLATPVVFVGVLPVVRGFVGLLAKVMPKDETTAVARRSFVGRLATVTTGRAESGQPAPARLKDEHGQTHYLLVEPDDAKDAFDTGTEVILISLHGAVFRAIRNTQTP